MNVRRNTLIMVLAVAATICTQQSIHAQTDETISGWFVGDLPSRERFDPFAPLNGFEPYDGGLIKADTEEGARKIVFTAEVKIDKPESGESLAIFTGPGNYPCDFYFNGVLIGRTGSYGNHYASTIYYSSRFAIDSSLIGDRNFITVEAFPLTDRNPLPLIKIVSWGTASSEVFWRNMINVNLIQASVVFAIVIAAFFFLLYFLGTKDMKYLYFAFVCASYSLAYINMTLFNDSQDELLLDKLSRCGLPLTSLFLAFFAMQFANLSFKRKNLNVILKAVLGIPVAAACLITLFTRDKVELYAFFSTYTTGIILPLLLVLTIGALIAAAIRKPGPDTFTVLGAFCVTIAASAHDIVMLGRGVPPFAWLVPYGYMAFVLSIFFVLALDQASVIKKIRKQSILMDKQHAALVDVVSDLTQVSEGLLASSNTLAETVEETLLTVENYGEENKAILSEFTRQAASVEEEIETVGKRLAGTAERVPKAIENQTKAAKSVNESLIELGKKISGSRGAADQSNEAVGNLSQNADRSRTVVRTSREALAKVETTSARVKAILGAMDELTERTNVLSINAAIESARFGNEGKGFAVVAQEIRKLAVQSQTSLKDSFLGVQEMADAIRETIENHDAVQKTLDSIIQESKKAVEKSTSITLLVNEQDKESKGMEESAKRLIEETVKLESLSEEERLMNEELKERLSRISNNFESIKKRLEGQDAMKETLFKAIEQMRKIMDENSLNIEKLKASTARALAANQGD